MRWIVRLAGILIGTVLLAVIVVWLIPKDKIADIAAREFEAATGRALSFDGAVRARIWPDIGVEIHDVSLANAPWSDEQAMLSAAKLEMAVELRPLLNGDVHVKSVAFDSPAVILERAADGAANWELLGADTATGASDGAAGAQTVRETEVSAPPAFSLDKATISNGRLRFLDHASGQSVELAGLDLELTMPDLAGLAELTVAALVNGQKVESDLQLTSVADLLQGTPIKISATAAAGANRIAFSGSAAPSGGAVDGQIDLDITDANALFAALNQSPPAIPDGLGAERIALSGALAAGAEGDVALSDALITLDQNQISGDIALALQERPFLTAVLRADALDLSGLTADENASAGGDGGASADGGAPADGGWSKATIDASGLSALDADVSLSANSIDLGTTKTGRARLQARLNNGRLLVEIRELGTFGGQVQGTFVVNNRGGLSVRGDLAANAVALEALFQEFLDFDRLRGAGDVEVSFLGVGDSLDQIMRSLDGEGKINFGTGELLGVDLVGMLRNLDVGFRGDGTKTVYDAITASFNVNDGVVSNLDLNFLAPLLTALGEGTIDLGAQSLNYRLTPEILRGAAEQAGISVPVTITGPWSDLKFAPDLDGLIDANFEKERERLEKEARDELARQRERLTNEAKDELGLSGEDSVEDALKERALQELSKGLGGLLGD
ncbi:MAG: AsmA family protein [Pseudomonadota bacterium]